ncbi:MAG: hypothetical protein ACKN9V_00400 [Pseudomonadota bacterium]
MWRISLSLIAHRFFILVIALSAIHFSLSQQPSQLAQPSEPVSVLWEKFLSHVAQSPEATQVLDPGNLKKDPFIWIGHLLHTKLGLRPEVVILALSNLFLILFLLELNLFINSLALPDVAVNTCVLVILWLTSYELSFGSALSLSCLLTVLVLRSANDDRWLIAGLSLAGLAITKPLALFLIPFLLLILVGQNRYASADTLARKLIYIFLPLSGIIYFRWDLYQNLQAIISDSALFNLISSFDIQSGLSWTLTATYLGQTIALLILLIGSIICLFVFSTLIHRLLPITLLIALLITTPYGDLATSALLIAPVFCGLAEACAPPLLKGIQLIFLLFGSIEVFNLF